MDAAITNLGIQYRDQFYNAEFIIKKDTEITDEDAEKYSLVLVGNAESNTVWARLAAKYPDSLTPYNPPGAVPLLASNREAFAEVFKSPVNKSNYLLLIGADELSDMALLENFDPCQSWFDCYVLVNAWGGQKELIFSQRPLDKNKSQVPKQIPNNQTSK